MAKTQSVNTRRALNPPLLNTGSRVHRTTRAGKSAALHARGADAASARPPCATESRNHLRRTPERRGRRLFSRTPDGQESPAALDRPPHHCFRRAQANERIKRQMCGEGGRRCRVAQRSAKCRRTRHLIELERKPPRIKSCATGARGRAGTACWRTKTGRLGGGEGT